MLILPPFQGEGHGAQLLETVHRFYCNLPKVQDITGKVEWKLVCMLWLWHGLIFKMHTGGWIVVLVCTSYLNNWYFRWARAFYKSAHTQSRLQNALHIFLFFPFWKCNKALFTFTFFKLSLSVWERNEQSLLIKGSCWLNLNTSLPRLCMELSGPTCGKVGGMYVNCRQFAAEMCWPHAAAQALSHNGIIIELCGEREISFHSNWIRSSTLLRQTCSHHSHSLCLFFFLFLCSFFLFVLLLSVSIYC